MFKISCKHIKLKHKSLLDGWYHLALSPLILRPSLCWFSQGPARVRFPLVPRFFVSIARSGRRLPTIHSVGCWLCRCVVVGRSSSSRKEASCGCVCINKSVCVFFFFLAFRGSIIRAVDSQRRGPTTKVLLWVAKSRPFENDVFICGMNLWIFVPRRR